MLLCDTVMKCHHTLCPQMIVSNIAIGCALMRRRNGHGGRQSTSKYLKLYRKIEYVVRQFITQRRNICLCQHSCLVVHVCHVYLYWWDMGNRFEIMPNLEHVYVYTYEVRLLRASIIHANLGLNAYPTSYTGYVRQCTCTFTAWFQLGFVTGK